MRKHIREGEISAALRVCIGRLIDIADKNARQRMPPYPEAEDYDWLADLTKEVAAAMDPVYETFGNEADLNQRDMKSAISVVSNGADDLVYLIRSRGETEGPDGATDAIREHGTYRAGAL